MMQPGDDTTARCLRAKKLPHWALANIPVLEAALGCRPDESLEAGIRRVVSERDALRKSLDREGGDSKIYLKERDDSMRSECILFLDIDGVLNSHDWFRRRVNFRGPPSLLEKAGAKFEKDIDPRALFLLDAVLAETKAKVVISSTWRKLYSLEEIQAGFSSLGFVGEIIDVTPETSSIRGEEIQEWLNDALSFNPPLIVERFAIVDDDSDMAHLRSRLVQTSFNFGLTWRHAADLIEMLGGAKGI
jgi:hypothetical protein